MRSSSPWGRESLFECTDHLAKLSDFRVQRGRSSFIYQPDPTRDDEMGVKLHQRAIGDIQEAPRVAGGIATMTLSDIRGDGACCPPDLIGEPKSFFGWECGGLLIAECGQCHPSLPDL